MSKDSTPPPITRGSFVSWNGGKGRVDLIVTSGKVPGVDDDVEGTDKTPAARVVVWEDGKATGKKIGASTHTLKRIAPLNGPGKAAGAAALVGLLTEHETKCAERGLPAHTRVTGKAALIAYERGQNAWPGAAATTLDADAWAQGRVERLVKAATTPLADGGPRTHDVDLLDPGHPDHDPAAAKSAPGATLEPDTGAPRLEPDTGPTASATGSTTGSATGEEPLLPTGPDGLPLSATAAAPAKPPADAAATADSSDGDSVELDPAEVASMLASIEATLEDDSDSTDDD